MENIKEQIKARIDEAGHNWGFWRHAEHEWREELATEIADAVIGAACARQNEVLYRIQGMCGMPDAAEACREILRYIEGVRDSAQPH